MFLKLFYRLPDTLPCLLNRNALARGIEKVTEDHRPFHNRLILPDYKRFCKCFLGFAKFLLLNDPHVAGFANQPLSSSSHAHA